MLKIIPFDAPAHLDQAVSALGRLIASGSPYPPRRDTDDAAASLTRWLMEETPIHRLVATVDGRVVGHIQVTAAHPYLADALDGMGGREPGQAVGEYGKFFVDPSAQSHGAGDALFTWARALMMGGGMLPALAVISTSVAAIRFYNSHGMTQHGSFEGVHGTNLVFSDFAGTGRREAVVGAFSVLGA